MKYKYTYPTTVNDVAEHSEEVSELFLKVEPHKGTFVGVALLDGSFLLDSVGEVYSSLEIGEILNIIPDEASKNLLNPPLTVCRKSGELLGFLPYSAAILPNLLISRGIMPWCHVEAKAFNGGMPQFAVSIYCEKY